MTLPVAVTAGDALGIGAEVAVAGFLQLEGEGLLRPEDVVFVGDSKLFSRAADLLGLTQGQRAGLTVVPADPRADPEHGHLPEIAAIATAVRGCQSGRFGALCTGPIHKAHLLQRGFPFAGHTGYLAHLCGLGPDEAVMAFLGGQLAVVLATVHIPLRQVPLRLEAASIVRVARAGVDLLRARFGLPDPRVAVCGLNPHAGEDGQLGDEEARIVAPAISTLRSAGILASGPWPADTLFARAASGEFDLVVALYHDQGLIPVKTLDFGRSVNVTLGLPIVRTSVDHGTARDLAWTGRADASPMAAALRMACTLRATT